MGDALLGEANEWTGFWWLPEAPDDKVPGVLYFDPDDGLRLDLIGGWEYQITIPGGDGSTIVTGSLRSWPMIHGEASGKVITLLDTFVKHAKTHSFKFIGKPDILKIRANTALVGALMEDPDEKAFLSVSAAAENLTAWSRRTGVTSTHLFNAEKGAATGEIELVPVDNLTAAYKDLEIALVHRAWQPYTESTRQEHRTRVRESEIIKFTTPNLRSFREWLPIVASMSDLVSLSTLSACDLLWVRLFLPPTPDRYPADHPMRDAPHEVVAYYSRVLTPKPDAKAVDLREMVLNLDALPFEALLPAWLGVHERFAAARQLILGLQYVTGGYLETQVVTSVSAAEAFHRALGTDPPITDEEFKNRRDTVVHWAPKEWRSWLSDRLMNNEPTLKQRLLELVERLGPVGEGLIPNAAAWAKAAADSRNKLAHAGPSHEIESDQLHAIVRATSAVVVLNLILELGVSQEWLAKVVAEHSQLQWAARVASEEFPAPTVTA